MRIRTSRVPKELQKITREGVKFFCENFLHTRTYERLEEINIKFVLPSKGREIAFAGPDDFDTNRPCFFTIEFSDRYRDILIREYMITLFHELTHVRQYATGQLRYLNNGTTNWRGKIYPENTNYWLQPWEVEAQGMEASVYQLFVAKFPEYGLKRYSKKYNGRHRTGFTGIKVKKPVKKQ